MMISPDMMSEVASGCDVIAIACEYPISREIICPIHVILIIDIYVNYRYYMAWRIGND